MLRASDQEVMPAACRPHHPGRAQVPAPTPDSPTFTCSRCCFATLSRMLAHSKRWSRCCTTGKDKLDEDMTQPGSRACGSKLKHHPIQHTCSRGTGLHLNKLTLSPLCMHVAYARLALCIGICLPLPLFKLCPVILTLPLLCWITLPEHTRAMIRTRRAHTRH